MRFFNLARCHPNDKCFDANLQNVVFKLCHEEEVNSCSRSLQLKPRIFIIFFCLNDSKKIFFSFCIHLKDFCDKNHLHEILLLQVLNYQTNDFVSSSFKTDCWNRVCNFLLRLKMQITFLFLFAFLFSTAARR